VFYSTFIYESIDLRDFDDFDDLKLENYEPAADIYKELFC